MVHRPFLFAVIIGQAERVRVPGEEGGERSVAALPSDREELLPQQVRQGGERKREREERVKSRRRVRPMTVLRIWEPFVRAARRKRVVFAEVLRFECTKPWGN